MLDDRRLRRVLEVGQLVVAELDLETVLARLLREARDLTGARYAALGILDESRTQLERFLTLGIDPDVQREIGDPPRGRGVLGVLIRDPRPLRLADVGEHPQSYGFPAAHPRMRAFLGVPVLVRGEAFGNLYLTDKQGADAFDEADEEAIVHLAAWAGIAIDNARSYTREHERRAELEQAVAALEATTQVARAIGGETDLDRVLELISKHARALIDARGLLILLREGDELVVSAVAGPLTQELVGTRVPTSDSMSGRVLRSGRSLRLTDAQAQRRHVIADHLHAHAALMVPLIFRGRAMGVLSAYDRSDGSPFAVAHERLLESFAASAATAVATAQSVAADNLRRSMEASERERRRWARELHDETLQQMASVKLLLSGARRRSGDQEAVARALDVAVGQLDDGIAELRRLIADLRPAALDELGIRAALEGLVERVTQTSGLDIALDLGLAAQDEGRARPEPAIESAAYRIVQEALSNVVKHAQASRVRIAVVERDGRLCISVADDGVGFDPQAATEGFGLLGMRERVALVSGTWQVEPAPGGGTIVRVELPVGERMDAAQATPHTADSA